MTLQERIDTLPPYPDRQQFIHSTPYGEGMSIAGIADYNQSLATAALARLALLREWISETHGPDCQFITNLQYWPVVREALCTCGRDALLAALEGP